MKKNTENILEKKNPKTLETPIESFKAKTTVKSVIFAMLHILMNSSVVEMISNDSIQCYNNKDRMLYHKRN